MSNYTRDAHNRLFDPVTGLNVGYVNPAGQEVLDYGAKLTAAQAALAVAQAAGGRGLDLDSRRYDNNGRPLSLMSYSDILGDSTIWFPLADGFQTQNGVAGSTIVADASGTAYAGSGGQLNGTIQGIDAVQSCWSFLPGLYFNGSTFVPITNTVGNAAQGQINGYNQSTKRVCDLSTLQAQNDMLLVWGLVSHKSNPSAGTLVSWGMSADGNLGGWAVGIAGSGKMVFQWTPAGAAGTLQTLTFNSDGVRGKQNDNTRSAVCWEICASVATPGWFEIRAYVLTVGTEGPVTQTAWNVQFAQMVPNGTGLPGPAPASPLMIGAYNTVNASTQAGQMSSKSALANLGLARRPHQAGLGLQICRNLRDAAAANFPYTFPVAAR